MRQYEPFELRFPGPRLTSAWAQADVTAVFSRGETRKEIRGFYDGDGTYVIRFLPETAGEWHWSVSGAVNAEGREACEPARPEKHGPVRAVRTHFEHADGALFRPFGTTVYALASQEDGLVEKTLETLKAAPFNKVRMCVFPKHYDYNHNEPPYYPFEKKPDGSWDVRRPSLPFWRRFESILNRISAMGIQIDLILFHPYDRWGFSSLSREENRIYLDEVIRRLAANPDIWWSLANEYDLCLDHKSMAEWEEIEAFVAEQDPYGHLLSCHNCMCFWDAARPAVTHASIQSKALTEIPRWIREYRKPVIIDECCYEGNLEHLWGSISGKEMSARFWRACASGAYCTHGETFLDPQDILWWARGGTLKGESPKRIAFLRETMESLPGPLVPVEEGLSAYASMSDEELDRAIETIDGWMKTFIISIRMMNPRDRAAHLAGEHTWAGRCGDEAFLWFHDRQCYGKQILHLPAGKHYRIEIIDAWNMTRETCMENASGDTVIPLPAREDLAVLALCTD